MGLLALFDKLVTEHGSALTQERNLTFLRDQIEKAEKENAKARDRIRELEGMVGQQVEQIRQLTEDCERYAAKIREYQQWIDNEQKQEYRLDEAEQGILRMFAEKQTNTLELDFNDTAVISLSSHKYIRLVKWNRNVRGMAELQLTSKGQKAIEQL
jgi:septal ring factor EnvC (AmiA/AmiB activator)